MHLLRVGMCHQFLCNPRGCDDGDCDGVGADDLLATCGHPGQMRGPQAWRGVDPFSNELLCVDIKTTPLKPGTLV